jgi:hypothetical protein
MEIVILPAGPSPDNDKVAYNLKKIAALKLTNDPDTTNHN